MADNEAGYMDREMHTLVAHRKFLELLLMFICYVSILMYEI